MKRSDALQKMQLTDAHGEPVPFRIKFCTADRTRNTGGELIELKNAVLSQNLKTLPRHVRNIANPKRVNQFSNAIRNVYDLDHNRYYKIHIYLILEFNGVAVV